MFISVLLVEAKPQTYLNVQRKRLGGKIMSKSHHGKLSNHHFILKIRLYNNVYRTSHLHERERHRKHTHKTILEVVHLDAHSVISA